MIVTVHMCMPEGDAMRQRFSDLMELLKQDNRAVIAAMMAEGTDVPDTMAELGLQYSPENHRSDAEGRPVMELYGIRDMVDRGTFSCGDATGWESAVLEEKYGIPTLCVAVAQGDNDMHGVFVTAEDVVDPTANFLSGHRWTVPPLAPTVEGSACMIEDGRVICIEDDVCSVAEDGTWHCPPMPGLSGRRIAIGPVRRSPNGQAWARTRNGAVVPVRRRR